MSTWHADRVAPVRAPAVAGAPRPADAQPAVARAKPVYRAALVARLDTYAWLTTVVAGAGGGKSTLLATWAADRSRTAYRPLGVEHAALSALLRGLAEAFDAAEIRVPPAVRDALLDPGAADDEVRAAGMASLLAAAFDTTGTSDRAGEPAVLVLDGLQELPAAGSAIRFVEALSRHAPRGLRLVVASRQPLPFPVDRLRSAGHLAELSVADLGFAEDETYQALAAALGDAAAADALAPDLHLITSGWPALVALSAGWLAQLDPNERGTRLGQLRQAVGPLAEYLVTTLLAAQQPPTRELIRHAAHLPAVSDALCAALGVPAPQPSPPFLETVRDRPGWYAVPPVQREIVLARLPFDDVERVRVLATAVGWYAENGITDDAFATAQALGDPAVTARLLADYGSDLVAAGRAADVARAAAAVPAELRGERLHLVEGEARHIAGDLDGALACYQKLARERDELDIGLACRVGNIFHFLGDLDTAHRTYQKAVLLDGDDPDEAMLLARISGIHWLRGAHAECRELAERALRVAKRSGDDRALAAAHNAVGLAAERVGDWATHTAHVTEALAAATRAGDLMSQLRIRIGRSQRSLEQARFADALAELDETMRLVEATGAGDRRAIVLINRGWAYRGLGRLDEAVAEFEAARRLWHEAGSELTAYAQIGLGAVYLVRGDLPEAEAVLTAAVESAERTGDSQSWAALVTLVRVRYATDPSGAVAVAERGLATNTGLWRAWALLSAGWVALHHGDRAAAAGYADQASEVAELRQDHSALAEELELRAFLTEDRPARIRLLREAQRRYAQMANPLSVARTFAAQAFAADDAKAAAAAEGRLRALGVRSEAARAAGPLHAMGAFAGARTPTLTLDGMRSFAVDAVSQGALDGALRWYLRILERVPDDEAAHLGAVMVLARSGRQGEARRRYRGYAERMRRNGVEPAPFPAA
jgi:ATP/maltotriose-dependent transcriptional regulator MalT